MTSVRRDERLPGWLLDEVASAGRENLDPEHVSRYDVKEDAGAREEIALLRSLGLERASVVVDMGAGTGQFTLTVAPHCDRVVAVDVSPVMLDRLRSKLAAAGVANVEVQQAGFLSYEHRGAPADIVYSRLALHHLPDAWKAIALLRLRSMIRPGGLMRLVDVVYDFGPEEAFDRLESWCASAGDEIGDDWSRAELEEHVRDEHSTYTWLLEPMIARAGFAIEEATHSDDGIFASYILRASSGTREASCFDDHQRPPS
jgi:ubiquinone/menaquinone biosynthesis C-methylase UbiE